MFCPIGDYESAPKKWKFETLHLRPFAGVVCILGGTACSSTESRGWNMRNGVQGTLEEGHG